MHRRQWIAALTRYASRGWWLSISDLACIATAIRGKAELSGRLTDAIPEVDLVGARERRRHQDLDRM